MGRGMGQAHFSVCFDILCSQLGFSHSLSPLPLQIRVKHRKPLEFQHQKQSSPAISLALNTVLQRDHSIA
ncbi:hypothetical protein LOK49_LG13G00665 [Camellia lanceoleosa]|uniref:Uncharacterized protein n=4 Tax=Camellia lanceoleosa TaxID=1840588 RepID=A0ACC0FMT8_9ERIC|nr:hypothetical protein LOK49_LG13G00671 [Camellia lanceoleosa]KAI7988803.1 hypothetical protein LOK49_LG13G00661 [Camellia lanceoleosa]KAI7989401.1 hypothetical protein LOK49_LG13G00662 [Camellia lanceoleosa]KAI7989407.1 hypothetical protein LOK49_LG13G00665 [Camellia lanceoleosa]